MAGIGARILSGVALLVLVGLPRLAQACSVCSAGREDENRLAFLVTTVFLSSLPLAMIGGTLWWLRRRVLQLEREQAVAGSGAALRSPDRVIPERGAAPAASQGGVTR